MARIPMNIKELREAYKIGIPDYIVGKMSIGIEPDFDEKILIRRKGKVYVEAHKREDKWVKPHLRDFTTEERSKLERAQQRKNLTDRHIPSTKVMRELQESLVRKPGSYEDISEPKNLMEYSEEFQDWYKELPMLEVSGDWYLKDFKEFKEKPPQYFSMEDLDTDRYYVVDTQGYEYPRYVAEIDLSANF